MLVYDGGAGLTTAQAKFNIPAVASGVDTRCNYPHDEVTRVESLFHPIVLRRDVLNCIQDTPNGERIISFIQSILRDPVLFSLGQWGCVWSRVLVIR